jgi:hypothetical protein
LVTFARIIVTQSRGTPIYWVAFGAHTMRSEIVLSNTKQLATKVKSNETITEASIKLKQKVPLSPKVLPNNS